MTFEKLNKDVSFYVFNDSINTKQYSQDNFLVISVINKMIKDEYHMSLDYDEDLWQCYFYKKEGEWSQWDPQYAGTMAEAICAAAVDSIIKNNKNEFTDETSNVLRSSFKMPTFGYCMGGSSDEHKVQYTKEITLVSVDGVELRFKDQFAVDLVDKTTSCNHIWKQYHGFVESYEYCINCNNKKESNLK